MKKKRAIQEIFNWLKSSKSSQLIDDFLQRVQEHSIACDCSKDHACD